MVEPPFNEGKASATSMTELAHRAPARCLWFEHTALRPPASVTVRSHGQVMAAGQHRHSDSCCLFHLATPPGTVAYERSIVTIVTTSRVSVYRVLQQET